MLLQKRLLVSLSLVTLVTAGAIKSPASGWTSVGSKSSIYSRGLGPPMTGMESINVPYMPKSPFFPKFVDPKMMISKKTDMLSNLFGGVGPAYPPAFKPMVPYGVSGPSWYSAADEKNLLASKTPQLMADDAIKSNIGGSAYKRGIFGSFGSKFGAGGSKFGPMAQFGDVSPFEGSDMMPNYGMKESFARKKRSVGGSSMTNLRSIMDDSKPESKELGPPPPYPTLAPISEEPEIEAAQLLKATGSASAPKEYMPGMFGPFGPGIFGGPFVDPSMFVAKKTAFLDTLFKTLATSTPSPTTTEAPVPKSTIVPPSFWFPTSIIPSPTEYNEKVTDFLDKLFENLKLNKTAATATAEDDTLKSDTLRSLKPDADVVQSRITRSKEDLASINAAKDTIVNSILSELGDIKSNMMTTMNDLITYEKAASAMPGKKPFKPFAPGMWAKPAMDVTLPFKQRMMVLSQVFDMLSDLQKNITIAIQDSIAAKMSSPAEDFEVQTEAEVPPTTAETYPTIDNVPFNMTLLDAIKKKLSTLSMETPTAYGPSMTKMGFKKVRTLPTYPTYPTYPTSFWVSYPNAAAPAKRETERDLTSVPSKESQKQYTRGVKMQMHQGYQSLPAGSIESVQAGGGSTPGHQGGGIKLLDTSGYVDMDKWINWMEYMKDEYQGRRQSHRHH